MTPRPSRSGCRRCGPRRLTSRGVPSSPPRLRLRMAGRSEPVHTWSVSVPTLGRRDMAGRAPRSAAFEPGGPGRSHQLARWWLLPDNLRRLRERPGERGRPARSRNVTATATPGVLEARRERERGLATRYLGGLPEERRAILFANWRV